MVRALVVLCLLVSVAAAKPTRVQIDLHDEAALAKAGFHRNAGGTSSFTSGQLVIDTTGYEEWSQPNGFVQSAGNPPGWAVEARVRLDAPCMKNGTGFWIHDGYHFVHAAITDHQIVMMTAPAKIEIGPTNVFRVIRFELTGDTLRVVVDGKQVWTGAASSDLATVDLMFGALGDGCARNVSTWDYLAYETTALPPSTKAGWHAGTQTADLARAFAAGAIPEDAEASCVAYTALADAVRDLLPLAYDDANAPQPAKKLRRLRNVEPEATLGMLKSFSEVERMPMCDPVPGHPCGPRPPDQPRFPIPAIEPIVEHAVETATHWEQHPHFAADSMTSIARAYAEAKFTGAAAARGRLRRDLEACPKRAK